jgi:hypothetical protein
VILLCKKEIGIHSPPLAIVGQMVDSGEVEVVFAHPLYQLRSKNLPGVQFLEGALQVQVTKARQEFAASLQAV